MQDSHAIFKSVNFAPHTLNQISSENASTLQCYAREIRMLITPQLKMLKKFNSSFEERDLFFQNEIGGWWRGIKQQFHKQLKKKLHCELKNNSALKVLCQVRIFIQTQHPRILIDNENYFLARIKLLKRAPMDERNLIYYSDFSLFILVIDHMINNMNQAKEDIKNAYGIFYQFRKKYFLQLINSEQQKGDSFEKKELPVYANDI